MRQSILQPKATAKQAVHLFHSAIWKNLPKILATSLLEPNLRTNSAKRR